MGANTGFKSCQRTAKALRIMPKRSYLKINILMVIAGFAPFGGMAQAIQTQPIDRGSAAQCCAASLLAEGYDQAYSCITIDIGSGEIEDDTGIDIVTPGSPRRPTTPPQQTPPTRRPYYDVPQPTTQIIPVTETPRSGPGRRKPPKPRPQDLPN